ncbi:MAG TPA: PHP domain-containing protein [Pseudomonadales bacterium]
MKFDLHCHSTASDGSLSPDVVLQRAVDAGVELFALTDHDTLQGFCQLQAVPAGLTLVSGIELSTVWSGVSIHVVGLDFDPVHPALLSMIETLRLAREQRAHMIDSRLADRGMPGALAGALQYCPDIGQLGRPHFAEYLRAAGYVASSNEAFDKWLGSGKIGDIKTVWPSLEAVVASIVDAGGVAVLAHPLRYKMTFSKLRRLVAAFREAGGRAVEVVGSSMQGEQKKQLWQLVQAMQLAGSGGSDFHSPEWQWAQIGHLEPLPAFITPVWDCFQHTRITAA